MGIIIKKSVDYKPDWSFHYDPDSISFFSFATEVCDASIEYVEEHLDEVGGSFLPGNRCVISDSSSPVAATST
jgi:hypothetical protein